MKAFALLVILAASTWPQGSVLAQQVIRERHVVRIGDSKESWQLAWDKKPTSVCGPDEVYASITCPCSGWAYGESGKLFLSRSHKGHKIEQMDLGTLFESQYYFSEEDKSNRVAYLQRWPIELQDIERENNDDPRLIADIKRRPMTRIMQFADYDRDGTSTEFLVQVATLPCMKHQLAAVGVSKNNPQLHALTSVAHPERPLVMSEDGWAALRQGPGEHVVHTWECQDHASETRSEISVSADNGTIRVKRRVYSCPTNREPEQLTEESDG